MYIYQVLFSYQWKLTTKLFSNLFQQSWSEQTAENNKKQYGNSSWNLCLHKTTLVLTKRNFLSLLWKNHYKGFISDILLMQCKKIKLLCRLVTIWECSRLFPALLLVVWKFLTKKPYYFNAVIHTIFTFLSNRPSDIKTTFHKREMCT